MAEAGEKPAKGMTDQEILTILKAERLSAVGFNTNDAGDELSEQRQTALNYIKGEMDDIKKYGNRSEAKSSDIADAIETVLPDLMEILAGGEDVGTFKADGPDDEQAAKQETEAVGETIFDQNPGFDILETAIKDALSVKTGLVRSWWQDYEYKTEAFEGKTAADLEEVTASAMTQILSVTEAGVDPETQAPLFNFEAKRVETMGCAKIAAVDPANFGVSQDTIRLCETPYCVERAFPRAFQLIDQGYDEDKVGLLRGIQYNNDNQEQRARDTVEESDNTPVVRDNMRRNVEIHIHTLRIDIDGVGKSEIWQVETDSDETLILSKKKKNRVGYAAGTPFKNSHRFYGASLADKLIEVQRIKTVLLRMMLDNGYFALNQRYEVAEAKISLNTISDLLRNEPGYPVRSKTGDAVRPLTSASLNFDVPGALEYMATVGEQRSGVVRNAQGLNPDTLHDTKGGMEKLFSAAQRRVRMIARRLAETLIKDLFLNVHGEIRDHSNHARMAKLGGRWVSVDPTSWGNRADMTIELGVGSGGKEHEILAMREIIGMQAKALEGQAAGIIKVPLVTETELYNSSTRFCERVGFKNPDAFFRDPSADMQQQAQQPEGPSPEEQAAMAELELEKQKQQAQLMLEAEKTKAQHAAMREKAALENQLAREKAQAEIELAREKMAAEMELAREKMALEAEINAFRAKSEVSLSNNQPGGRLDQ